MFKQLLNIDTAFKHLRLFTLVVVLAAALISCFSIYKSFQMVHRMQERIYILASGKALEAFSAERKDNIPVEARDHIKMFHHYFMTLSPDEELIKTRVTKALYLADGSAKNAYDNLRESGYYTRLVSGNMSQEILMDSIHIQTDNYPFYFRYYGSQKIVRSTSIVTRRLVTQGYLREVMRSDNNPHGFLIEKWKTLENEDITVKIR
ncbi:conjugal transfer protein [Roseivirga seohaensis]|jgi:conjugative transposon TraK protein|uniref:Conjugal transfer protein n=1 Tax=Roseivirga seohaensis TaxID=1914963 RepID=A0A150XKS9_9BACT|nr:conjugative transposon protein TraK [Roseivirga seohaensis]KYG79334.1 conjugal transfer protein [Roseivirga seohaensis]